RRRLAAGRVLGADDLREARREPEPLEDERAVPGRRGGGDGERHAGALQIVHEREQPWEWLEARAVERAGGALLLLGEDVERLARELVPEQRRQDLVVLLARELVLEDRRLDRDPEALRERDPGARVEAHVVDERAVHVEDGGAAKARGHFELTG